MRLKHFLAVGIMLAMGACADRDKNGKLIDNATSGSIKIAVDESLRPLLEAEIDTFEALYTEAHVEAIYMSESEAIEALLKDSVRLAVTTRTLLPDEKKVIESFKITPREMAIAKDGVALILHKSNLDSLITFDQLKGILEGKITDWNQINPKSRSASIEVVFDNPTSGMVRFLNDSVVHMDKIPSNWFALNTNKAVVEYVSQKPNALGLIGVGWISDRDDSTANSFLSTIRVAGISREDEYFQPFQAYIAMGQYPLQRKIFMLSREARTGLASGFMSFVGSDKGQRIVLKLGLVPITMPVRIVEITHEPLF